jgi:glyceraldehyde-3-phosphate dehydrogenase (NAD(P))
MTQQRTLRVAINGYGVIGKRVADAVASQDDMVLAGVADTAHDWRTRVALSKGFRLYGATKAHADAMHQAGIAISGTLDDLLDEADIVVDCTPKSVASQNIETYRQRGLKFIVQGGEKHETTGHSFVAETSYASAIGRDCTRVVSCNTTSIVRTLTALKRRGLLLRARGTLLRRTTVKVQGDELFYAYMVDNQAIVIPETIDAIRALTGIESDADLSIGKTNASLGIGSLHL